MSVDVVPNPGLKTLMAAMVCAVLLAGCAKTTVVRSPSASRSPSATTTPRPAHAGATTTVRKGDTGPVASAVTASEWLWWRMRALML